jgi:hypothetical protein
VDDGYGGILQRIEEAGWESEGGIGEEEADLHFNRQPHKLSAGVVEGIQRLGLFADGNESIGGDLLPGYLVSFDNDSNSVTVGFYGKRDEKFDGFLEDLVEWGEELNQRQEEALTHQPEADEAGAAVGRLIAQLSDPESTIGRHVEAAAETGREDAVARVVRASTPNFLSNMGPAQSIKFLEALFAVTVTRQDELLEKDITENVIPEFNLLAGIGRGIQRELVFRRDIQAVADHIRSKDPID